MTTAEKTWADGNAVSFSFSLPSGVTAEVIFDGGTPTKRAVAKLRQYLALFEDDLADDAPDPRSASERDRLAEIEAVLFPPHPPKEDPGP